MGLIEGLWVARGYAGYRTICCGSVWLCSLELLQKFLRRYTGFLRVIEQFAAVAFACVP